MDNTYLCNENKGFVWQLLTDNNAFVNIPDSNFTRVKSLYEEIFLNISKNNQSTLIEKNKLTIKVMMEKLVYLRKHEINKPLEEVQIKIDKDFLNKQEEFIQLIKKPSPEEVK